MRPTRRAVLIFAPGVPLALILVIADPGLWALSFDYAALVLVAIASDALLALPRRHLRLAVAAPERAYIGEAGRVAVTIAADPHYPRAVRVELLADLRGEVEPAEIVAVELPPDGEARAELRLLPRRRGRVYLDRVWLRWRGPLRLIEVTRVDAVGRTVDVLPNIRGAERAALSFQAQEQMLGVKPERQRGEGSEFEALREYAPGLDTRFIDWKHSARHRRLLCKEFRTERNHPVMLAFDTGYLMREPIDGMPRLDHAINAGLLLAWISLQAGDLVGIFGFDATARQYLAPLRGTGGFARLQQAAATLDYGSDETNFTLGLAELEARLKRRALVILFTEFVDTVTAELLIESMRRMASRHVVVFVTLRDSFLQRTFDRRPERFSDVAEAVIADDLLRERSIVLERLERMGVHCLDVPSRGLSAALVNRYLLVKERGQI
jgi:uncharacterized protein (DUF58 family)